VVTPRASPAKLTQKIGTVRIEGRLDKGEAAESQQLCRTAGASHRPVKIIRHGHFPEKDEQTTTVIAHDGKDGQLTRGRGALSFRIGDFFSGKTKSRCD